MDPFNLGDVVSLTSHPYTIDSHNVVISGEALLIPPLMVIIETIRETKDSYDEKTGHLLASKGHFQCKCMWYSSKSSQFEETWIHSRFLKKAANSINISKEDISACTTVSLKTLPLELKKRKASLTIEMDLSSQEQTKTSTTALLSFVSPLMHVMQTYEIKGSEIKEPLFDSKTGTQKRMVPQWNVKCKWFNPHLDKFSETIIPLEALRVVKTTAPEDINMIQSLIKDDRCIERKQGEDVAVMKPKTIVYRSGEYYVNGFNFISNKTFEVELSDLIGLKELEKHYVDKCPDFKFTQGTIVTHDILTDQILQFVADALSRKSYIRIKYVSRNNKVSIRTLDSYQIENVCDLSGNDTYYLVGYCNSRKERRTFKVDRISMVEELDARYIDRDF